jgi:hypothetical protein
MVAPSRGDGHLLPPKGSLLIYMSREEQYEMKNNESEARAETHSSNGGWEGKPNSQLGRLQCKKPRSVYKMIKNKQAKHPL